MKCHYEVLNVPQDADDSTIKTSYRKLALKWHPDKNQDPCAKEQFQLLQQAYFVLSDPHERAWYDKHRVQILRGRGTDFQDTSLDIYEYFRVSCFTGYDDDPKGFYAVYSDVFKQIAAEEIQFMESESECEEIPIFGKSDSDYDAIVGRFYGYWQSYSTKKTFTWLCPYDITEIRERRILRGIEKEMKKIVQTAKLERNDEIRALVEFVKKRDKRVQNHRKWLEQKAMTNRQKQQDKRSEQIRKNLQEASLMQGHVSFGGGDDKDSYEKHLQQIELDYQTTDSDTNGTTSEYEDNIEGENVDGDKIISDGGSVTKSINIEVEEIADNYVFTDGIYCTVCNKSFKNECSFRNHELSKKHKTNLLKYKSAMPKGDCTDDDNNGDVITLNKETSENEELFNRSPEQAIESDIDEQLNEISIHSPSINDDNINSGLKQKKNKKKNKKSLKVNVYNSDTDEFEEAQVKKDKEQNINKKMIESDVYEEPNELATVEHPTKLDHISSEDEDNLTNGLKQTKKNKKKNKKPLKINETRPDECSDTDGGELENDTNVKQQNVKEKVKRDKPAMVMKIQKKSKDIDPTKVDINHTCVKCSAVFNSKNKLFNHLKEFNHGIYIERTEMKIQPGIAPGEKKLKKKK